MVKILCYGTLGGKASVNHGRSAWKRKEEKFETSVLHFPSELSRGIIDNLREGEPVLPLFWGLVHNK